MIIIYKYKCPNCNKVFHDRDRRRKYCSRRCCSIHTQKDKIKKYELKCFECGKTFHTNNNRRGRLFGKSFCNMECYIKYRIKTGFYKKIHHPKGPKNFSKEFIEESRKRMLGNKFRLGLKLSIEHRKKISIANGGSKSSLYLGNNTNINGYTPLFNKQLKERIRVRDGFKCRLCGVPELECKSRLSIHHIDFDKSNCNEKNLISLCNPCHAKTKVRTKLNLYKKIFEDMLI